MSRQPAATRRDYTGRDDGRISLMVAILVPALLLLIAATVDGGGQIRAMQRADNIAAQAARAAGQAIDVAAVIGTGVKRIDPALARQAADRYLSAAGATGTTSVAADGQSVTVVATVTYTPVLLSAFGRGPTQNRGRATAALAAP
jgi:Flp pilus assembly protein TadG